MATFQSYLEQDKERFLSLLSKNGSVSATIKEVENQLDRMLYNFSNEDESDAVKDAASRMIQTAKNAASFLDTSGETQLWKRTRFDDTPSKGKRSPLFGLWLLLCLFCCFGSAGYWIYLFYAEADPLYLYVPAAVIVLGGLFGIFAGMTVRRRAADNHEEIQAEVAVDIQKVYRSVLSTVLIIDRNLEDIRTSERIQARKDLKERKDSVNKEELDLLAHLLEAAYATRADEASQEMISQIKFYLHNRQIETVDYSEENARWFDQIPAYEKGTLRPAFTTEGILLKKGLASFGSD